jgi:hypothetical protein
MELVNIWRVVSGHDKRKKYRFAMAYSHEGGNSYEPETFLDHESMNEYQPPPVHYYEDRREYRKMPLSGHEVIRERRPEPEYGNKDGKKNKKAAVYNRVKKRKYRNRFEKKYAKYLARTREHDAALDIREYRFDHGYTRPQISLRESADESLKIIKSDRENERKSQNGFNVQKDVTKEFAEILRRSRSLDSAPAGHQRFGNQKYPF